jgi:2,5-furandicarboxylate decarboxylase 1
MAQVAADISDLGSIIQWLDGRGRLVRVRSEVDPAHQLAGVAAKFERGPRAVLFEKVKGSAFPVFTGLYWSRELLGELLDKPVLERCRSTWPSASATGRSKPVAPVAGAQRPGARSHRGDCVDLSILPVPTHAELDGGPYFDAGVVITKDPETGIRNTSIQRFQVVGKDRLAINIDAGRHLELCLATRRRRATRCCPSRSTSASGPACISRRPTPAEAAPFGTDELGIASRFHGRPLELVGSSLTHVEMVADAMFALECEMMPGEAPFDEGPFAEVTGYYATVAPRPLVRVRRIHRRRHPVFQTIISGGEVFNSVGLLGEANVLALLQKQVPGVKDVYFSHGGCGFYHAVVQIAQKRAGWAKQALMAAFAAFPPLKMVTVVDDDVDIRNPADVEWAMATRLDPKHGILVIDNVFGHGLNPTFPDYLGSKVGFDATRPFPHTPNFTRARVKPATLAGLDIDVPEIR